MAMLWAETKNRIDGDFIIGVDRNGAELYPGDLVMVFADGGSNRLIGYGIVASHMKRPRVAMEFVGVGSVIEAPFSHETTSFASWRLERVVEQWAV